MKLTKPFKFFVIAFVTIGSSYAQSSHIPTKHTMQHRDLLSIQSDNIFKVEDGSKLEDQAWFDAFKVYFYPDTKFSYVMSPNSENPNTIVTYSLSDDGNNLTKITEIRNVYSTKKMAEEAYKLTIDKDKQAIISTHQIIQNIMGTYRASNKITLFLLPKDSKSVRWTETVNGETLSCSAKYVYISFTYEGKKLYHKAVKIEKTTPLDKSTSVKEWSYWVKGLSRLASYGYWGDPKKVSCIDKSVNIDLDDPIIEISKAKYDSKR
ncbi:MAG: hypothetical protein HDS01_02270 [Bacteroides sp.]|nr:hypothetical protein [Bacteroides sp.]